MRLRSALTLALVAIVAGCARKTVPAPVAPSVTSLVGGVTIGSSAGLVVPDGMPSGGGAAPSVAAGDTFVVGSSTLLMVAVDDSATALLVGAAGHPGYYRIALTPAIAQEMLARTRKLALTLRGGERLSLPAGGTNLA